MLINTFRQSRELACISPELGNSVGERGFSLSLMGCFYTADGWRQKRERRALSFRERHGGSTISDAFWMSQWVGRACSPWKEGGRWCEADRMSGEKQDGGERERDKGWVMREREIRRRGRYMNTRRLGDQLGHKDGKYKKKERMEKEEKGEIEARWLRVSQRGFIYTPLPPSCPCPCEEDDDITRDHRKLSQSQEGS